MEPTFWLERWREGRIGFHEGVPNRFLARHVAALGERRRVLVPLCGKSDDLAFLAGCGHEVVGVELVEDAARAFFTEHGLTPTVTPAGALTAFRAGPIAILAGDFFAVTPSEVAVDAVYDRAALIALPLELRERYVEHVRALIAPTAVAPRALVVSLEYDQTLMAGPPFAVLEAEVRALYRGARVTLVDEAPDAPRDGRPPMQERCFVVEL